MKLYLEIVRISQNLKVMSHKLKNFIDAPKLVFLILDNFLNNKICNEKGLEELLEEVK